MRHKTVNRYCPHHPDEKMELLDNCISCILCDYFEPLPPDIQAAKEKRSQLPGFQVAEQELPEA